MIILVIIQATQYLPPYFVMKINAHISIVHSHRYKILRPIICLPILICELLV